MVPPEGAVPNHLHVPKKINKVWHVDLLEYRFLWFRFNVIGVVDGFSRKLLRLKIISGTVKTSDVLKVIQAAINSHGQPQFIITDHGSQFKKAFMSKLENITVVKGKVRQPSFNGKIERLFKTLRIWLRLALLPITMPALQLRFDQFQVWYNELKSSRNIRRNTRIGRLNSIRMQDRKERSQPKRRAVLEVPERI
jgi:transposase InsO family protein